MKKKRKRIYAAILKSIISVSALLLILVVINLIHLTVTEKNSSHNPAASEYPQTEDNQISNGSRHTSDSTVSSSRPSVDSSAADTKHSADNSSADEPIPAKNTSIVFTGDIYPSDYVLANYEQSGIQGILSKGMHKELSQADFAIANNEFPFSTRGTKAPDKQFTFRIDPSYVSILQEAGIDAVTLANNHVLDYGTDALTDTFHTLDTAGIDYAGAGNSLKRACRLIKKHVNGITFGLLAASRVFPEVSWNVENAQPGVFSAYDPSRLLAAVTAARSQCSYLCVYLHWGIERNTTPETYQVSMAHALIDAGADAVIGAHPHVLQGVEFYQGKPIFYSLGNFIFYQTIDKTAIAKLTLTPDGGSSWQLLGASAANACTSLLPDAVSRQEFYQYMTQLSVNAVFSQDGTVSPKNN